MSTISQRDAQRAVMERSHDLWEQQRAAIDAAHTAIRAYADLKFEEYITVRGCDKMAAAGVVRDHLERFGDVGREITNRLVCERVF